MVWWVKTEEIKSARCVLNVQHLMNELLLMPNPSAPKSRQWCIWLSAQESPGMRQKKYGSRSAFKHFGKSYIRGLVQIGIIKESGGIKFKQTHCAVGPTYDVSPVLTVEKHWTSTDPDTRYSGSNSAWVYVKVICVGCQNKKPGTPFLPGMSCKIKEKPEK